MVDLVPILLIALLGWAAASDARSFIIPNRISAGVLLLYPAWVITAWPAADPLWGLATGIGVLALGIAAFALRWFGGGDVKLIAALAVWAGPSYLLEFLFVTSVAGAVISLAMLLRSLAQHWLVFVPGISLDSPQQTSQQRVPYGVAIATGGAYLALQLLQTT